MACICISCLRLIVLEKIRGPVVRTGGPFEDLKIGRLVFDSRNDDTALIRRIVPSELYLVGRDNLEYLPRTWWLYLQFLQWSKADVWGQDFDNKFVLGRIVRIGADAVHIQPLDQYEEQVRCNFFVVEAGKNRYTKMNNFCSVTQYLNVNQLYHFLRTRFLKGKIYSYVAKNTIIVMISKKNLRNLYSSQKMSLYHGKSMELESPHVFAIADKAYRHLKSSRISQSIIVTGVRGSGKTESVKHILNYLFYVSGATASQSLVRRKILAANTILEAFGHRRLGDCDNSTRFIKFLKIQFDSEYKIVGGHVSYNLLKTLRFLRSKQGNRDYRRSFHIFYMLLAGAPESLRRNLHLTNPDDYIYLQHFDTRYFTATDTEESLEESRLSFFHKTEGALKDSSGQMDDAKGFHKVDDSLSEIGLSENEKLRIYSTLAAILHLGNMEFKKDTDGTMSIAINKNNGKILLRVAKLLRMDSKDLHQIIYKLQLMMGENPKTKAIESQASTALLYLIMRIYSRLFDYIVRKINACISVEECESFIGILDSQTPRADDARRSNIEQFFYNYFNEKLEYFYRKYSYQKTSRLLESEEIKQKSFRCPYTAIYERFFEMFERPGSGILDLLDNESTLSSRGNSHNFTVEVYNKWQNMINRNPSKLCAGKEFEFKNANEGFLIGHTWGTTLYLTNWFITMNSVTIPVSIEKLMLKNEDSFMKDLLQNYTFSREKTVASHLRSEIEKLISCLEKTEINFVRCIRPDDYKESLSANLVIPQLKHVYEMTFRNYPFGTKSLYYLHFSFDDLYEMCQKKSPFPLLKPNGRLFCEALCRAAHLRKFEYKLGKTRVFFLPGLFIHVKVVMNNPTKLLEMNRWLTARMNENVQENTSLIVRLKSILLGVGTTTAFRV